MKAIIRTWRNFLQESTVKYQGILMINPGEKIRSQIEAFQSMLPEEAQKIASKDLHVTLIHQSVLKPFHSQIENLNLPGPPPLQIYDKVFVRKSPGKKSWVLKVQNQEEFRTYVRKIMKMLGSSNEDPEPERMFHITLANLTGNPHDSVR